ncbi:MAG: CRISPR-associated endonuclease Cas2 [Actinobacteria bacterium]|jgi:CRISPR-associated protein Cas2|nr:CRISPR-associated endonuclease Cas2 [Actinomycetota bacterium]
MISEISKWRAMWMVVMFDLPVKTKAQKTSYRKFHGFLLNEGFLMMQYSIYGRHCPTREAAEAKSSRVHRSTPHLGQVRILRVTEAQFARMEIIENYAPKESETVPLALEFW